MRMCSRLFHFPCIFYRRRTVVPLVPSYLRLPAFACVLVPTLTSMHFAPRTVGCSSCRPRCRVHRPQLCACSHRRAALVCFPCSCPAHASSAAAKHLRPRRGFQGQARQQAPRNTAVRTSWTPVYVDDGVRCLHRRRVGAGSVLVLFCLSGSGCVRSPRQRNCGEGRRMLGLRDCLGGLWAV